MRQEKERLLDKAADKAMEDKENNCLSNIEIGVDVMRHEFLRKTRRKVIAKNSWGSFSLPGSQQKWIQVKPSQERSICGRSRMITVHSSSGNEVGNKKETNFVVRDENNLLDEMSMVKLRLVVKKKDVWHS